MVQRDQMGQRNDFQLHLPQCPIFSRFCYFLLGYRLVLQAGDQGVSPWAFGDTNYPPTIDSSPSTQPSLELADRQWYPRSRSQAKLVAPFLFSSWVSMELCIEHSRCLHVPLCHSGDKMGTKGILLSSHFPSMHQVFAPNCNVIILPGSLASSAVSD